MFIMLNQSEMFLIKTVRNCFDRKHSRHFLTNEYIDDCNGGKRSKCS